MAAGHATQLRKILSLMGESSLEKLRLAYQRCISGPALVVDKGSFTMDVQEGVMQPSLRMML